MSRLRIAAAAVLAVSALGVWIAPGSAAAQTNMATKEYEVSITNLTAKQAITPPLLATHPTSAHVWQEGQTASDGLKLLAEEGMTASLAASLKGVATEIVTADAPVMPGTTATFKIKAHEGDVLSVAAMLGQTNDGFTGLDSLALTAAAISKDTMAYDGGVEENTEKATDVPGPPFEGHNSGPQLDPRQPIAMHPGISGKADVGADFGWSGAVARISVHPAMSGDAAMGGSQGSTSGGTDMGSTTAPMPEGMPDTGAGGNETWLIVLAAAGALLGSGLGLRKLVRSTR